MATAAVGLGSRLGKRTREHFVAAAAAAVEQVATEGHAGWTVAVAATGCSQSVGRATPADQGLGLGLGPDEQVQPEAVVEELLALLLVHRSECCKEYSGWLVAGARGGCLQEHSRELGLGQA